MKKTSNARNTNSFVTYCTSKHHKFSNLEHYLSTVTAAMLRHRFLLVTYPAQSHINPSLQFAKQLVSMGAQVTLPVTLHVFRRMTNKVSIPGLSLLPFSDGFDDGFPDDADYSLYVTEFKRRGSEFVRNLIVTNAREGHPFTCLVYTILLYWAADVAREFHLPRAVLWVQPATVFDIYYHYFHGYGNYLDEKITKEPSCLIELPELPLIAARDLPSFLQTSSPAVYSVLLSMFEEQFRFLDLETNPIILVNTFEALEADALRAVDKFNMIAIGPLIPSAFLDGKDITDTSFGCDIFTPSSNGYVEWLDSKPEASVVYVSFGSLCVLSKTQMEEISRALLDCGFPFLWVIRENQEKEMTEELRYCREELKKKGKIVKWCSQVEVLSHRCLGCFVTHCGWNSTMESLACGVPVVAFPQWGDQKMNAKLIEEVWKTGVRVDHEDGTIKAEEIRRCLEIVMENGEELRRNAKKWKYFAREAVKEGGSSEKNWRDFLNNVERQECIPKSEK